MFSEGVFRFNLICRFKCRECRVDRGEKKKIKKKKRGREKERRKGAFGILCKGASDMFAHVKLWPGGEKVSSTDFLGVC